MDDQRSALRSFIGLQELDPSAAVVNVHESVQLAGFSRSKITFASDGELVEAFYFEPAVKRPIAVVVLHQHNSQWHIGKSEIAGLVADPLQAFGPALARAGISVLAPDAVGFESRCTASHGREATPPRAPDLNADRRSTESEWLQYYNHAMHRVARGELLMRKVLIDVANATSALSALTGIAKIGVAGHSYGGNVALFAGALDTRLAFTVSSGALCSYQHKFAHGVGLEMALVIPGFAARFDFDDLLRCIAPRSVLIVSSDADPLTGDAEALVDGSRPIFERLGAADRLCHFRVPGPHALDQVRHEFIVEWISNQPSVAGTW